MRVLALLALAGCGESWTFSGSPTDDDSARSDDSGAPDPNDRDEDGHRSLVSGGDDCWDDPTSVPEAYTAVAGRDQPAAADVHPDATDAWYDGVDADCAGDDDFDQDGDGHRSAAWPDGAGATGDDCYDAVEDDYPASEACGDVTATLDPAAVHPDADDAPYDGTDADCAGDDDWDVDADGFPACEECDDEDPLRYPSAVDELWYNGVDEDCDGNDGDRDGDGFYVAGYAWEVPAGAGTGDCWDDPTETPEAYTSLNGFPALAAASVYPGATETWYDGVDADCARDGDFDRDADGQETAEWVDRTGTVGPDCDDSDAAIYAGAPDDWYDDVDADCAGNDDFDADADGWDISTDCDEGDASVSPGAAETCATAGDDDCDGDDNDEDALGCLDWSADADRDGYGSLADTRCLCIASGDWTTAGVTPRTDDCDDADIAVNPGETEVCDDGVDQNCDGAARGCGLSGAIPSADATLTGETTRQAGSSLGAADLDGDGADELYSITNNGTLYVISDPTTSATLPDAGGSFTASGSGNSVGALSGGEDVDGDGYDDLLLGAYSMAYSGWYNCGGAYLFLGGSLPTSSAGAGATYDWSGATSSCSSRSSGYAVALLGDVDGDGLSDVGLGAHGGGSRDGAIHVAFSGSLGSVSLTSVATFTGPGSEDGGMSITGGGDMDGDGLDDVAATSPEGGWAFVLLSVPSGGGHLPTDSDAVLYGVASPTYSALAIVGDTDADGYDDLLVGAAYASAAGKVFLVRGPPGSGDITTVADATLSGSGSESLGYGMTRVGDVDGDGRDDFAVSAMGGSTGCGSCGTAYVFPGTVSGSVTPSDALAYGSGTASGELFGQGLVGGDFDGNGGLDLAVSAPSASSAAGEISVFLGGGI